MSIKYHLGKDNIIINGLSMLFMESLSLMDKKKRGLENDINRFTNLGFCLLDFEDGGVIVQKVFKSSLGSRVKEKHDLDPIIM